MNFIYDYLGRFYHFNSSYKELNAYVTIAKEKRNNCSEFLIINY